jgi:hypothetical protein
VTELGRETDNAKIHAISGAFESQKAYCEEDEGDGVTSSTSIHCNPGKVTDSDRTWKK